jgi:ATP-binding cassette subfamily F protein 3
MGDAKTVKSTANDDAPKLLDKAIVFSDLARNQISDAEQASIDTMWGFDKIRKARNEQFEATDVISAKDERKAAKEQKKWLEELDNKLETEEEDDDNNQISSMTLPDLSGASRERDIHVSNFTITFGGKILLEGAHLRLVYGRRYGLVGVNGVGKTTLLKHMAAFDIEGFPRHHRVLHVKQEVKSSELSVLQVVLEADIERTTLIKREKVLLEKQQAAGDEPGILQAVMDELAEVYERLKLIGAETAESRAAMILSGLQFTEQMQLASTSSLSGGWRMRVALAGALFIEPDLLMLDEVRACV